MLTQMAKYLDTVYVSGWQCSSTASSTDEPSPDLADYPMVKQITHSVINIVLKACRILSPTKSSNSSWPSFSTTASSEKNELPLPRRTVAVLQTPISCGL